MRSALAAAGICGRKSNSKYALPFDTVSVVGTLKIVDWASAFWAASTKRNEKNNLATVCSYSFIVWKLESFDPEQHLASTRSPEVRRGIPGPHSPTIAQSAASPDLPKHCE